MVEHLEFGVQQDFKRPAHIRGAKPLPPPPIHLTKAAQTARLGSPASLQTWWRTLEFDVQQDVERPDRVRGAKLRPARPRLTSAERAVYSLTA